MFSSLKKTIRFIHLWLGLLSGLVVFIVAITGAIWSFEAELSDLFYDYRKVEVQNKPTISISKIKEVVSPHLKKINAIYYYGSNRSIEVREWNEIDGTLVNNFINLNPYTGEILKIRIDEPTFFDLVLDLHINLLLGKIGHQIVSYATLVFLVILITGIYLWWPKKRKGIKQRMTFDWKSSTKWRRKNFDLHSILGFYASWIIIFVAITGLAWSFKWVDKTIYAVATLGEDYKDYTEISSQSYINSQKHKDIDDFVLNTTLNDYKTPIASWNYYFAQKPEETISIYVNPDSNTYYKSVSYYFDQRTAKMLFKETPDNKNKGQYVRDMYYDIHIGKILGLPGQLLVFFASLLVASLPVTGFLIWYGRRKKS
jgi:uncharacterized iron-regulated membrane protein